MNKWSLFLLVVAVTLSVHAATPASQAYVNQQMAFIQAQIDEITFRVLP